MSRSVPELLRLSSAQDLDDAFARYHRVDAAAFGLPPDAAQRDAKRAMQEPDRWYLASLDGVECGGAGSFATELTLPGPVALAASAVSDVGVLPSHRRRGVLSALMARQLADTVERGEHLAVLHASEGSIYRRFGYGACTRWRSARIDARRTSFRDDLPVADGSLEVVAAEVANELCPPGHDAVRRRRVGGLARSEAWWSVVFGTSASYLGGDPRQLVMVHRDDEGRPDGYAIYTVAEDWSRGQANHSLDIWELVGSTTAVELALLRALVEHDLVETVTCPLPVDHAIWDVVVDARQIGLSWEQDLLWARILDVEAVLGARSYAAPGSVVLGVDDPFLGRCTGSYLLQVAEDGTSTCERTDAPADLGLDISELGSTVLGGTSVRRLSRAGRVTESTAGAAAAFDAMAAVDPLPWCWVRF